MNGPNPPSKDAIKRINEIFNDPSHNNDISKFPTHEEFEELKSIYDLTSKQIMAEFHKMQKKSQFQSLEQYQNRSKRYWTPPRPPYQSIMESATHLKIVHLNEWTSVMLSKALKSRR